MKQYNTIQYIKFMVANLVGKNKHVAYVANIYFRNAMSSSSRNINKVMSEYKLDYRLLQLLHAVGDTWWPPPMSYGK